MEESKFPGFLGILMHAQTVCTRLSFPSPPSNRKEPGFDLPSHMLVMQYIEGVVWYTRLGSPQDNFRIERMGVASAEFVTTSIILVTTSKK